MAVTTPKSQTLLLFSLLLLLHLLSGVHGALPAGGPAAVYKFDKLFAFGDSYADTGNIGRPLGAWREPYGITFPGKPAGRFSDGRVFTDYLAEYIGIQTPLPYKYRRIAGNQIRRGMNFAYGGTGVFATSGGGPNLTTQIDSFQKMIDGGVFTGDDLESSIAFVSAAGNDFTTHSQKYPSTSTQFGLNYFNVSASKTASICNPDNKNCHYKINYGDGTSTSGYYVTDVLFLNNVHTGPFSFGCSTNVSGLFATMEKTFDGIFGFGHGPYSIVAQLAEKRLAPRVFSHCLRGDGDGGSLVFGEALVQGMVYGHLLPRRQGYRLNLRSISVNGRLLDIRPRAFAGGALVDSGTVLAYLADEAYDPFINAITATVSRYFTVIMKDEFQCFQVPTSKLDVFPEISLHFADGSTMILQREDYIQFYGINELGGDPVWCIFFRRSHGSTILGELVLKNKVIVYDMDQQRVGWVNYNCSLPLNVSYVYSGISSTRHVIHNTLHLFVFFILLFIHWLDL